MSIRSKLNKTIPPESSPSLSKKTVERDQPTANLPLHGSGLKATDLPPVLTAEEARTYLRLGRTAFYQALHTSEIPCAVRIGHVWRIPRDALLAWLGQDGNEGQDISSTTEGV